MPRDLADVLHYFLTELEEPEPAAGATPATPSLEPSAPPQPSPLPVLGLPIGDGDVVRAALAWNLTVETARLGGTAIMLAPQSDRTAPLWPEAGIGPHGAELRVCPAKDLASLHAAAREVAGQRSAHTGGVIFLPIPAEWLRSEIAPPGPPRWHLLLSGTGAGELDEAVRLGALLAQAHPEDVIGLCIRGAGDIQQARTAFEQANSRLLRAHGREFVSYGFLANDLHVYRAIAAQQPVSLIHPGSPAARTLADVARLLLEDVRSQPFV